MANLMAQNIKAFAATPDKLSSSPGTHISAPSSTPSSKPAGCFYLIIPFGNSILLCSYHLLFLLPQLTMPCFDTPRWKYGNNFWRYQYLNLYKLTLCIICSLHSCIQAERRTTPCSHKPCIIFFFDSMSSSSFLPPLNLTSISPHCSMTSLLPLDHLPPLALRDGFHGNILGYPFRLHFPLGSVALVSPAQILLKVLYPPRSGFLEEMWWQPSSHSCPIPKSRHSTDSIYKTFLTTLSFSLFLNQLQCKFLFYFIAWNYYNNLCPLCLSPNS